MFPSAVERARTEYMQPETKKQIHLELSFGVALCCDRSGDRWMRGGNNDDNAAAGDADVTVME